MSEQKKKIDQKKHFIEAVGRRREATARVRFYYVPKSGTVTIRNNQYKKGDMIANGLRIQEYFPGAVAEKAYMAPLRATDTSSRFVISIQVQGGGVKGQLNAAIHGIARVLDEIDTEEFHPILKKRGFLTRDPRMKERRKAGYAQKARARKQSPKR